MTEDARCFTEMLFDCDRTMPPLGRISGLSWLTQVKPIRQWDSSHCISLCSTSLPSSLPSSLPLSLTDRPEEAEEAYSTALSLKPDHINANTNMGHLCRLQGRWEEARHYFTSALARRPTTPTLHYFVGMASEEIGTERDIEVYKFDRELSWCEFEWNL